LEVNSNSRLGDEPGRGAPVRIPVQPGWQVPVPVALRKVAEEAGVVEALEAAQSASMPVILAQWFWSNSNHASPAASSATLCKAHRRGRVPTAQGVDMKLGELVRQESAPPHHRVPIREVERLECVERPEELVPERSKVRGTFRPA
jgi:hypothetical protein